MTKINLTAQHWDGVFNETLNWYNFDIDVDDILEIKPKEILIESCDFFSRLNYQTDPLRALGSHVLTRNGNIIVIQSPDEIKKLIKEPDNKEYIVDHSNIDDYISKKASNYINNEYILSVRANQKAMMELENEIAKKCLKILGIIFVICVVCFPMTTYEFIKDVFMGIGKGFEELARFFMRSYI